MNILASLGKSDLLLLLETIEQSLLVKNSSEMRNLLERLAHQLPTRGVVAGLIPAQPKVVKAGEVPFLNIGYSEEWLKKYLRNDYFSCDPIKRVRISGVDFMRWSDTFAQAASKLEKDYIHQAKEHDLHEGVTIGANRLSGGPISFFSFIGNDLADSGRDHAILRYLSPYLHEAMCKAVPTATAAPKHPLLSQREIEVLSWAMAGKTNWEISMILNISERTVKFHIQNVMGKLQASSRAHAVAIALGEGLICG